MTETAIINLGLARAQISARLTNWETDTTAEAKAARDCFERIRNGLLRKYLWSFAKKRVELAQVAEVPAFGVDRAFALPADFIRTITVHPSDSDHSRIRYSMETLEVSGSDARVILANCERLYLRYVARQTSPALMDDLFVEVLAWALAAHFAQVIKQSSTLAEQCRGSFKEELNAARAANSIENWPDEFPEGTWTEGRLVEGANWAESL